MKVNLEVYTPTPIEVLFKAYRLCYSKGTQEDIKVPIYNYNGIFDVPDIEKMIDFIKRLLPLGHTSPLEHVNFTFYISGVSRSLTHQLVRHRTGSYSQQSQRYVKSNQFEYVIPPAIKEDTFLTDIFKQEMLRQQVTYDDLTLMLIRNNILRLIRNNILIDYPKEYEGKECAYQLVNWLKDTNKTLYNAYEKKAIEDARYVLPNACTSNITVTMDLNNFRKFYALRSCKDAQWEIRELAELMMKEVKEVVPFADYYAKNCGRTCNKCMQENSVGSINKEEK